MFAQSDCNYKKPVKSLCSDIAPEDKIAQNTNSIRLSNQAILPQGSGTGILRSETAGTTTAIGAH